MLYLKTMKNITTITYRVPYADTDKMAVVYYANYFVYFERLRNELIRNTGMSYKIMEEKGIMFPVLEAHCEYFASAKYDDILTIDGWLESVEGARFKISYEIRVEDKVLVQGFTVHIATNPEFKPRRVPEEMKKLLIS
jgi:acyl-CoA thioester hydrolase